MSLYPAQTPLWHYIRWPHIIKTQYHHSPSHLGQGWIERHDRLSRERWNPPAAQPVATRATAAPALISDRRAPAAPPEVEKETILRRTTSDEEEENYAMWYSGACMTSHLLFVWNDKIYILNNIAVYKWVVVSWKLVIIKCFMLLR